MSLPALLQPSSPHHEDFLPVYLAITSPPPQRPPHERAGDELVGVPGGA